MTSASAISRILHAAGFRDVTVKQCPTGVLVRHTSPLRSRRDPMRELLESLGYMLSPSASFAVAFPRHHAQVEFVVTGKATG